MKRINKNIFVLIIMINFPFVLMAKNKLIGMWLDVNNQPTIELIQGFKPNTGIAIIYDKGKIEDVEKWKIEDDKVQISYHSGKLNGNILEYRNKQLKKSNETRKITNTIELKKEPNIFIDVLTSHKWLTGNEKKSYLFFKGFSNETGIYNKIDETKSESEGLGEWSVAKNVFNFDSTLYLEAIVTDTYMMFLDKSDRILFLNKSDKLKKYDKLELKEVKEKFVNDLNSGEWLSRAAYSSDTIYKFRPVFGDLSGLKYSYSKNIYGGASEWEYSLKTGSLKMGYTEYINAQIQGPYLLLLQKNGDVTSYQRPKGKITKHIFSNIKNIEVSEKDTNQLQDLLNNQLHLDDYTYQFIFKNNTEGYLHKFKTYPFLVSGNKFEVKDWSNFENLKFYEKEIVFGKNKKSLALDSKQVYLKHISEDESKKLQAEKKSTTEKTSKKSISMTIVTKDGKNIRIPLPVGSFQDIVKLTIEPN